MWGGDFREGKTSNVELDAIYRAYLPSQQVVPSDTMVHLDRESAMALAARVRHHGRVFFPIFVMKHWIAGVLSKQPGGGRRSSGGVEEDVVQLTTYDSAPSTIVEEQLSSVFRRVWPELRLGKGSSPRQERNSNDCGLFMSAAFFARALEVHAVMRRDLPACLRRLLYAAKQHAPPKEYFLNKMRKVLTNHPVSRKDRFYDEIAQAPWKQQQQQQPSKGSAAVRGGGGGDRRGGSDGWRRTTAETPRTDLHGGAGGKRSGAKKEKEKASAKAAKAKPAPQQRDTGVPTPRSRARAAPQMSAREAALTNPPLPRSRRNRQASSSASSSNSSNETEERELLVQLMARRATERKAAKAPTAETPAVEAAPRTTEAARTTGVPPTPPPTGPTETMQLRRVRRRATEENPGRAVAGWAEQTLAEANKHERRVYRVVLDHLWAATAMAMVGDGVSRGLSPEALGMQRLRSKLLELQPYSVQEILKHLYKPIHHVVMEGARGAHAGQLVFRDGAGVESTALDPFKGEYYLARGAGLERLPETASGYVFMLGAHLCEAPRDMDGIPHPGYYRLTRVAAEAAVGVYIPAGMTHYSVAKPMRAVQGVQRYVPVPRSMQHDDPGLQHQQQREDAAAETGRAPAATAVPRRRDPRPEDRVDDEGEGDDDLTGAVGEDDDDEGDAVGSVPGNRRGDGYADTDANISAEARQALADIRALPLNMQGRSLKGPGEGAEACPRNWFLFAGKPPHISQLAWNIVRPGTRALHLRWLTRIKAMPEESLRMSLSAACVDLILATARARRWKWATTAKAFAGVAGSLRNLPLYSTHRRGIRLQDDPEWRNAFGTVQRYTKESVPDAPPFVTLREARAVLARLKGGHARAALFLAMMWGFAARAGDISTLRCKDVTIFQDTTTPSETHSGDTGGTAASVLLADGAPGVRVCLTVRRGKGTKKRGPYPIPSVLTRELAATLQQMLTQRRPAEELFAPYKKELRKVVAFELGKEKRGAQLPSVRKGALRCMADAGVPIKDLMTLSGHTKHATLLRYLGYGQQPTVEDEAARANASRALFPTL
ncbi:Phage integrase family [Novymonas esmeraldas]|uniref:Phage integrase family n=1 Tax=Novymonas esmeraldas TaxID=1808958 RepID=A0AAW0F1D0_9TRYP